jgi:toxin FitB
VALIVLDTDVASSIVRGRPTVPVARALGPHVLCVTFVTVAELTEWGINRSWGRQTLAGIETWLARVPKLWSDEAISRTWGRLSAETRRAGRPRPINDMWIAACCIAEGLPLATLNTKDYVDFVDHGLDLLSLS